MGRPFQACGLTLMEVTDGTCRRAVRKVRCYADHHQKAINIAEEARCRNPKLF